MMTHTMNTHQKRRRAQVEDRKFDAITDLVAWSGSGMTIEKPEEVSFRKLRKAVADGETVHLSENFDTETPALDLEKEVFRFAEVLLIEHDWAGVVNAANFRDAEIRLPFDVCAFEFRYSGRPVVAIATQLDGDVMFSPMVLFDGLWMIPEIAIPLDFDGLDDRVSLMIELVAEIADQIRAACIAIDARVAQSEPRAATRSPGQRNNAQQKLKGHHVVSLARRQSRSTAPRDGGETGRQVRLHFRRGHWRHFESHKTWINWMLVGDPDLGFVEKHYRL